MSWSCDDHVIVSVGNKYTTNAVLSAITSPLVALTVMRCIRLSIEGLENLAKHCHHTLHSLDVSYCHSIKNYTIEELKVYFPELKRYRAEVW